MLRKIIAIGVVLFALVSIGNLTSAEPWQQGQTWGYKWEYDMSKELSTQGHNYTGSFSADGKVAYLYYVKYVGMENGKYRFDFAGTFYAWAHVSGTGTYEGITGEANLDVKSLWVNFEGYFYLVEDEVYDWWTGENHTYYKMTYLNMHIYTKEDIDISLDYKMTSGGQTTKGGISIKGNFDIQLEITFDPGLPYLPGDSDTYNVYEYTYADYNTHVKANLNVKMEGEYDNGQLNFDVNKNFSGSVYMFSSLDVEVNGNQIKVTKPSIITESGKNALYPFGTYAFCLTKTDPNVDSYVSSLQNGNKAIYDSTTGYYSKQTVDDFSYVGVGGDYSSTATVNEVNDARNNAPAKYGAYSGNFWIYIIIIVVVVVVVLMITLLVALKRKKPKQPVYPQQQYQQTYSQQQYQQYPPPPQQQQPPPPPNFDS